jgi:hypothetical protein
MLTLPHPYSVSARAQVLPSVHDKKLALLHSSKDGARVDLSKTALSGHERVPLLSRPSLDLYGVYPTPRQSGLKRGFECPSDFCRVQRVLPAYRAQHSHLLR